MPIIRSLTTAAAASGLPKERGGSSAVGRGRLTDKDQQHYYSFDSFESMQRYLQFIT